MRSGCVRATLASATIGYEICKHSACFLPLEVGIHEFCPTYVCAKYWEKHWHEWLMHVLGHLQ